MGEKPDLTIFITCKNKTEYLLVTEIKSPRHKREIFLDDKYKLGNEMKDTLVKMIDDGIKNKDVVICGLLVQGK